jgi:hypothetical protein
VISIHLKTNQLVLPHEIELSPLLCAMERENEIIVPRVTKVHGNDRGRIIYCEFNSADIRLADNLSHRSLIAQREPDFHLP